MSRYKHKSVNEFLTEFKLKIIVRTNNLDKIEEYISNSSDKFYILLNKFNYKITQDSIDRFKDKEWFKKYYLEYTPEELLIKEENKVLLNEVLFYHQNDTYSHSSIRKKLLENKELIKKFIQMGYNISACVNEEILKENDYELLKIVLENNNSCDLKSKDLILKALELGYGSFTIGNNIDYIYDKDIISLSVSKGLILPNYEENYELIKLYLDNNIEIDLYKCKKYYKELYNEYNEYFIKNIHRVDSNIFSKLLFNNEILDVDVLFEIDSSYLKSAYFSFFSLELIKKYATKLNNDDCVNSIFTIFSKDDVSNKDIENVIKIGFPNIINYIPSKYINNEIINLAIDNGYNNYNYIYTLVENNQIDDLSLESKITLVLRYIKNSNYISLSNKFFQSFIPNEQDDENTKKTKETLSNKIVFELLKTRVIFYDDNIYYKKLIGKILEGNEIYDYINSLDSENIAYFYSKYIINENVKEKFKDAYKQGKIDMNLMKANISSYGLITTEADIKNEINKGYTDIFNYVNDKMDVKGLIEYAIKVGYKTDKTNRIIYDLLKTDILMLSEVIKINIQYINFLHDKYNIQQNIDLINECINTGVKFNIEIQDYLNLNKLNENNTNNNNEDYFKYIANTYKDTDVITKAKYLSEMLKQRKNPNYKEYFVKILHYCDDEIVKLVLEDNEPLLNDLITQNLSYVRFADNDYLEKNKVILINKFLSKKSPSDYCNIEFFREYIFNMEDTNELLKIIKKGHSIIKYVHPNLIINNPFLFNILNQYTISNSRLSEEIMSNYQLVKKYVPVNSNLFSSIPYKMFKEYSDLLDGFDYSRAIGRDLWKYICEDNNRLNDLLNEKNYIHNLRTIPESSYIGEEAFNKIFDTVKQNNINIRNYITADNPLVFEQLIEKEYLNVDDVNEKFRYFGISEEIADILIKHNIKFDIDLVNKPSIKFVEEHIEYINSGMLEKCTELTILHLAHSKKFFDYLKTLDSYSIRYLNEIVNLIDYEDIKEDYELLKIIISHSNNYHISENIARGIYNSPDTILKLVELGLPNSIDFLNPDILLSRDDIYSLALEKGYNVSKNTDIKILTNVDIVLNLLNKTYNSQLINKLPYEVVLNISNNIFYTACQNGYTFSDATPKLLLSNLECVKILIGMYTTNQNQKTSIFKYIDKSLLLDDTNGLFDLIIKDAIPNSYYGFIWWDIPEIINNSNYIEKMLKIGLFGILKKISCDKLTDSIRELIYNKLNILYHYIVGSKIINDKKICEKLCENGYSRFVIENAPIENISEKEILKLMISGYNKNYLNQDSPIYNCPELLSLLDVNVVNLKKAIDLGLEFPTIIPSSLKIKECVKDLINIGYISTPTQLLKWVDTFQTNIFLELITHYLEKGNAIDVNLYWKIYYRINNIETFLIENCTCINLINTFFGQKLILKNEKFLNELNSNKVLKQATLILNDCEIYDISSFIIDKNSIYKYFDENGIKNALYEEALFNSKLFSAIFKNPKYIKNYNPKEEVKQYIEFTKVNGFILTKFIKKLDDISKYFDKDGINVTLFEEALFDSNIFGTIFKNPEYIKNYNPSDEVIQYINFTKDNGLILKNYINTIVDISKYFDKDGIKSTLCEEALFDSNIFGTIFKNLEYIKNYNPTDEVIQYINFTKDNGFVLKKYINTIGNIQKYFDKDGIKATLCEEVLFDSNIFSTIFKNPEYIKNYNPSDEVIQYIRFTKDNSFILTKYINTVDDITKYFDKNGVKLLDLIKLSIEDIEIFENLDEKYFEEFYKEKFANDELKTLLVLIDNNYKYFSKFIIDTASLVNEHDDKLEIYNNYISNVDKNTFRDIIKYVFYSGDETSGKFTQIVKNEEYELLLNVYNRLYGEWDVKTFKLLINNFEDNKELCKNIIDCSNLDESIRFKLFRILINGDQAAIGKIQTLDDLNQYNKILYENNENIISSNSKENLKYLIFKSLFNMGITGINRIIDMYSKSNDLMNIKESISNSNVKEIITEYADIIKFIKIIYNSNDITSLKIMAAKINEYYKNNKLEVLYNLWDNFYELEHNVLNICGMEINEKIINFDEFINTSKDDIPQNEDGSLSFDVSSVELENNFEYDGIKFNTGSSVKLIDLNGIPFVAFGHVLNAYGSGGKLSDFNHPRTIGRTHLCLSAIDDNFYSLVKRDVIDIEHVQILFTELPSNKLVIASERDVGSCTNNNSFIVTSWINGNFNPIRENISNTYHGSGGYNEYVYYRDGLMPSAILIKGEEPLECEIQAAAYLSKLSGKDIPLVRINKDKYPVRTDEEMKQRDEELQTYYQELYKRRKKISDKREISKLRSLREILISMYNESLIDETKKVI